MVREPNGIASGSRIPGKEGIHIVANAIAEVVADAPDPGPPNFQNDPEFDRPEITETRMAESNNPTQRVMPTLRITSYARSKSFYVDGLGFQIDWEHRFQPAFPVFMQVSRDGLAFFLAEHKGERAVSFICMSPMWTPGTENFKPEEFLSRRRRTKVCRGCAT